MSALCHTTQDLINALRARKTALGLSNAYLDELAGYTPGLWDKMCGPANSRVLSLNCLLTFASALGLAIQLVEDRDGSARLAHRWQQRSDTRVQDNGRISREAAVRVAWSIVKSRAASRAVAARWRKTTPEERKAISDRLHLAKRMRTRTQNTA